MSRFTGPLLVSFTEDRTAIVWEVGREGSEIEIRVPTGFQPDGASVPRILWALMPAWGDKGTRAAILHDYMLSLVEKKPGPEYRAGRAHADKQFLESLLALGVAPWRARLCYYGVRAWSTYNGGLELPSNSFTYRSK